MAVIMGLIGLWLTMLVAGGTPIGRSLRRWTVEKPAARLSRISRTHVAVMMMLVSIGIGMWLAVGHDGLSLYGMAMPELTGMLASIEVTGFIDAAIAVTLVATSVRWSAVRTAVAQRMRAGRARKVRRTERPASSNDDEGPAPLALAA